MAKPACKQPAAIKSPWTSLGAAEAELYPVPKLRNERLHFVMNVFMIFFLPPEAFPSSLDLSFINFIIISELKGLVVEVTRLLLSTAGSA